MKAASPHFPPFWSSPRNRNWEVAIKTPAARAEGGPEDGEADGGGSELLLPAPGREFDGGGRRDPGAGALGGNAPHPERLEYGEGSLDVCAGTSVGTLLPVFWVLTSLLEDLVAEMV